jgi:hypothetical protein
VVTGGRSHLHCCGCPFVGLLGCFEGVVLLRREKCRDPSLGFARLRERIRRLRMTVQESEPLSWPTLSQRTRKGGAPAFLPLRVRSFLFLLADYEEMAVVLAVDFAVLADGERSIGCAQGLQQENLLMGLGEDSFVSLRKRVDMPVFAGHID